MKKITFLIRYCTLLSVLFLSNNAYSQYCVASGVADGNLHEISRVQFNTIDNSIPQSTTIGYYDFTGMSTDLQANTTNNLIIDVNVIAGNNFNLVAFFDFNQDDDFADAGERINLGIVTGVNTVTTPITIPLAATIGLTRMRLVISFDPIPENSCDLEYRFGDVQDYSINITAPAPIICANTVTVFPYTENFETGLGLFEQANDDDIDWTRDSAGTPSGATGPATGSGDIFYMYTESSTDGVGFPNMIANLESPCFDLTGAIATADFSFAYHLFGANIGSLNVDVSTDNGATYPTTIFTRTGQEQTSSVADWTNVSLNLNSFVGQIIKLRFRGTTGLGFNSDIAIDNTSMTVTIPTPNREINVTGLGNTILNGDITPVTTDNTDFGNLSVLIGTDTNTFTIQNLGTSQSLNLTMGGTPNITGANAADFTITLNPTSPVGASSNTTFDITFNPSGSGLRTATVSIANNDADENPYTFDIQGTGTFPPPEFTLYYENFDENDGNWTASTGSTTNWEHGNTILAGFNEIAEGSYWSTGTYTNNVITTLESPIMSTTGFNNLQFSADIRFDFDADPDDGMVVQYRERTAGVFSAWTTLGANGQGQLWYDAVGTVNAIAAGSDGWSGTTTTTQAIANHFNTAVINLPAVLEDSAEVQFRFLLASDGVTADQGATIDNILIYADPIIAFPDPSIGPGSLNANLKLWLKATAELGSLADGTNVSSWRDEAFDNDAIGLSTNSPTFRDNVTDNINFNPVINFDRASQQYLRGKGGYFASDYFVVMRSNGIIDNLGTNRHVAIAGRVAELSPQVDGTGLGIGNISGRFTNEVIAHMSSSVPTDTPNENSYGRAFASTTESFDEEVVIYNIKTNTSGTASEIYRNGIRIDNVTGFTQGTPVDLNFYEFLNQQFYVGVGRFTLNGNVEAFMNGRITEIASYRSANSVLDQQKIQSYLAIKNGITLHASNSTTSRQVNDIDYINSQGDVIWDTNANTGFNFDIAGIGRDDDSGLLQRQSASENKIADAVGLTSGFVSMSLTQKFDTNQQNITNNTTNFNDREYLTWGNNGADINLAASTINVDMSAGIAGLSTPVTFIGMQRTWKVVENGGDIPSVQVSIPQSAIRNITPPGSFLMFVSDTNIFDPTADYRVMNPDGNGNLLADYNFDDTKFITFGYAPEVIVERSIFFDGIRDYVDVEDHLDLNPTEYTMSAWINRASGSLNSSIVSKRNASFSEGYDFKINNAGRLEFSINGGAQTVTSSIAIPQNIWHQVAVIYDGVTATLYIDGVADTSASMSAPINTNQSFLIAAADGFDLDTTDYFEGNIDEVRVWDTALSVDQLRYIMNQEIIDNGNFVDGDVLTEMNPDITNSVTNNEVTSMPFSDLAGYYPMSVYTYTNTNDLSSNNNQGALRNLNTVDFQTAPLPYESTQDGDWDTNTTWANGAEQIIPGLASIIDATIPIAWNIVRINDVVQMDNSFVPEGSNDGARSLLGLFVEPSAQLNLMGNNDITTGIGTGNGLQITHYLKLDGKIDLQGESQLIQLFGSDLDPISNGFIEKDQQGTRDLYTYNYWSSPVGPINNSTNNNDYTFADIYRDGTDTANPEAINFLTTEFNGTPNGGPGNPIGIADYWIFKFSDFTAGQVSGFQQIRSTGSLQPGEGFTLKGVEDTGGSVELNQNYVTQGKPNNGDISLPITAGNNYLIGNPYASALDANQFILDNGPIINQGNGDGSNPDPDITGTLYFWDHFGGGTHVFLNYQGGYATYSLAGGTPPAISSGSNAMSHPDLLTGGIGTLIPGRFVPVGQGFFVLGQSTGTINFNNGQRRFVSESVGLSVFFGIEEENVTFGTDNTTTSIATSNTSLRNDFIDDRMKIRFAVNTVNQLHRQMLVTVDPNTTAGIDWGYEAPLNETQIDDMFWMVEDGRYNIQAIDDINNETILPIGIFTGNDGNSSFTIDALENVPDDLEIFVHDKELNIMHNLRADGDYEFFLLAGEYLNRFELMFENVENSTLSDDDTIIENLEIYYSNDNDNIVIVNPTFKNITDLQIVNLLGQSVYNIEDIPNNNQVQYPIKGLATGVYLLILNTDEGRLTKKVLID